ncbi:MFS transporter [Prauserella shujinwangii]|uniref:MFS transporter n=1 Tax=Prauserella shujinwangii TaxID=1453103 RepID=A0A2T0LYG4_9PSEU|nr:MFS transporter [Prauserella shujinwangii]
MLFADTGLSGAEISALFAVWSAVGIAAEVPSGALADRFSRRGALVLGGVLQALGYVLWTAFPGFAAFAAGFALWGLGGAFVSGASESLVYDGLAAAGARAHFARVHGWMEAAGQLAQVPVAVAATVLFATGGYELVGWVSVGMCLAAAAVAARLPEPPRSGEEGHAAVAGYLATLRTGLREALSRALVRRALLAVALLTGLDAIEEYFPLMARAWGLPTEAVPLAMAAIPLVGALGSAFGGRAGRLGARGLTVVYGLAALLFAGAAVVRHPAGLALIAAFYGLYRAVLVVADARLQDRIGSAARATVTSVAGLATELAVFSVYLAWVAGEMVAVTGLVVVVAAVLPYAFRAPRAGIPVQV